MTKLQSSLILAAISFFLLITWYFIKISKTKATPVEILFVGDSFTHGRYQPVLSYNNKAVHDLNYGLENTNPRFESHAEEPGPWGGIPGIFAQFTQEAGLNYRVSLEAVSAKGLSFQANPENQTTQVIYQPKWDVVVLQNLSFGALPTARSGNLDKFLEAVQALDHGIHAANPKARIYLYQTWPRADWLYLPGSTYSGQTAETMNNDIAFGYQQASRINNCCTVIPVGNAWMAALENNLATRNPYNPTTISLWALEDKYHPSKYGAYLSALMIYATVTGMDPRQLGYENAAKSLGITRDIAINFQNTVYGLMNK